MQKNPQLQKTIPTLCKAVQSLGDNPAEEVLAALASLDQTVRKDAEKPAAAEDQALSATHLYRLLNAKKQMEKAKQKLQDLDVAWKNFQQMVMQRIKEQKDSLGQRTEAVQVYQQRVQKLQEAEKDLKSRTAEAGALSIEDTINDSDLQAMLKAATEDADLVDVDAMPMESDAAASEAFTLNLKPFGRFKPNTTSPKRKIEESGKDADKEEGPPKSKGPKK